MPVITSPAPFNSSLAINDALNNIYPYSVRDVFKLTADLFTKASESNVWDSISYWFKIMSISVSIFALVAIIYIILRMREINLSVPGSGVGTGVGAEPADFPWKRRWEEVLRHLDSTQEAECKFSVIEADKLLDEVLKKANFKGDTLGEMLTLIPDEKLKSINSLWWAHKLRNRLVHQPDYSLSHGEVVKAIEYYQKGLEELEAI